ncbi:MAG: class F sortase [Candidatus Uhrbacteria bacterium]
MSLKISKKIFFVISLVGTVFLTAVIFLLVKNPPGQESFAKQNPVFETQINQNLITEENIEPVQVVAALKETNLTLSIRLKIPKISLDAAIESIGLTPQGAVDVPKDPGNAAWYSLSSYPGEVGNAIITGHFGRWKNGEGSVFDNLNQLSEGDSLSIENESGVKINFVVRELRLYDQNDMATDVFISNDGKAHLNLITCDGVWNNVSKSFSKRLVVFADLE